MATIKDIAKYTGLSVATVSKYLNGGNVLVENRKLLEKAVKKLNYRMNHIARGLKTRKSMTVGILIPRLNNIFYTSLISHVEDLLSKQGYSTIICAYQDDPEVEKEKLDFLLGKSVDGIIFVPLGAQSRCVTELRKSNVPVVFIDRSCEGYECDMILSDNAGAAYDTVRYLAQHGHRRIGIVLGPEGVYTADERYRGYCRAVTDLGLDDDPNLVMHGNYRIDGGRECVTEFMQLDKRPTALIITNYEMTIGGIIAIESLNISIPEDLSVIGFDNLELTQVIKPPLSVVVQKIDKMSEAAVELLLKRVGGNADDNVTVQKFKTELVCRESVKSLI